MTHALLRGSSAPTVVIVLSRMALASGFIPASVVSVVLLVASWFSVVCSRTIGVGNRGRLPVDAGPLLLSCSASARFGVMGLPLWSLFMLRPPLVVGLVMRYRWAGGQQQHRHRQ
jgi:hypothetical protein